MTEEKDKKEYEISFLTKAEEQGHEVVNVLNRYKAEITNEGQILKMRLAYPIKKETNAYFGYAWFIADPATIPNIETDLRLSKDVLRFLLVTPPVKKSVRERQESVEVQKPPPVAPQQSAPRERELTNEDLEKKLEEILQ